MSALSIWGLVGEFLDGFLMPPRAPSMHNLSPSCDPPSSRAPCTRYCEHALMFICLPCLFSVIDFP